MSSLNPYDPFGPPALTQVIPGMINIADSAYYAEYGEAMVEAAEAGIESQRRWTLHHMGCIEKVDPIMGKEWVKQDDSIPIPEATFGLRARMFARLQEGVSHMAKLKPKAECPLPEQEMRWLAHALGHEFRVSNTKTNGRGVYVDACLGPGYPIARAGIDAADYERHLVEHKEWIDEDYRAHLGYKAVLLASGRDLKECA